MKIAFKHNKQLRLPQNSLAAIVEIGKERHAGMRISLTSGANGTSGDTPLCSLSTAAHGGMTNLVA